MEKKADFIINFIMQPELLRRLLFRKLALYILQLSVHCLVYGYGLFCRLLNKENVARA